MMKHNTFKRISACAGMLMVMIGCLAFCAFADDVSGQGAAVHASYRHPVTKQIEDAGGESSEALGQSMVDSMVDPQGFLETDADGNKYLSMRFHLMSNVSKVELAVQKPGESEWSSQAWESTAKGEDSEDIRVAVPSQDAVIRAKCFVDAMGRDVVFFVTADQFTAENPGGFAVMGANPKTSVKQDSAIPANTVGLVTGGSDKGSKQGNETNGAQNSSQQATQEVEISASIWVMVFVVAFCAQILACLTVEGLKILKSCIQEKRSRQEYLPKPEQETDDENFDMDFLNSNWEEKV